LYISSEGLQDGKILGVELNLFLSPPSPSAPSGTSLLPFRQLRIVKPDATDEQVRQALDAGVEGQIFSQALLR